MQTIPKASEDVGSLHCLPLCCRSDCTASMQPLRMHRLYITAKNAQSRRCYECKLVHPIQKHLDNSL